MMNPVHARASAKLVRAIAALASGKQRPTRVLVSATDQAIDVIYVDHSGWSVGAPARLWGLARDVRPSWYAVIHNGRVLRFRLKDNGAVLVYKHAGEARGYVHAKGCSAVRQRAGHTIIDAEVEWHIADLIEREIPVSRCKCLRARS